MSGTTFCPHCNTRFKVAEQQLEAHQGMVRCGHCLEAFDARPGYAPDQPSPQLELPILDNPTIPAGELSAGEPHTAETIQETIPPPTPRDSLLEFKQPDATADEQVARPMTLAEQISVLQNQGGDREALPEYRRLHWAVAALLLLLLLLAQTAYFFRIDLAARVPDLKPALDSYCQLLGCSVPLPQRARLMSIESSNLEAESDHENQISLNALLRNSAPYPQTFPHLELTLNDTHDAPLARRIFKPKDYLPPAENEQAGMRPNHELSVKLRLHTAELRPTGYRLVLFYPQP